MKSIIITIIFSCLFFLPGYTGAVEKADKISDREIIESLVSLKEGQAALIIRIDDTNKRIDDINGRIDDLNGRIDDLNGRIDDVKGELNSRMDDLRIEFNSRIDNLKTEFNSRIDDLKTEINNRIDDLRSEMRSLFHAMQWMFGIFITLSLVILGFILRLLWKMQSKQVEIEANLAAQREETAFLKTLIEKLIPSNQTASKVLHS